MLKLTDEKFKASDNSRNLTVIMVVDFSRAFNLSDQSIL